MITPPPTPVPSVTISASSAPLAAPGDVLATISIIRDFYVAEKYNVKLDDHVIGLARCSNPNCITNKGEPVSPEFEVICRNPPQLRCCYCDRMLTNISDNLL